MRWLHDRPKVVSLRFRKFVAMDATGAFAMERLHDHLRHHHNSLILCGVQNQPLRVMEKCGLLDKLERANVCPDVDAALARARQILSRAGASASLQASASG